MSATSGREGRAAAEPVRVLWTAGWDSTFRVCQLLHETAASVEPHYVLAVDRPSTPVELSRLQSIRDALAARDPTFGERLLPLVSVSSDALTPGRETAERYRALAARHPLGTQYAWLSDYAASLGAPLELAVHADDKAVWFLSGNVRPVRLPHGTVMELVPRPTDPALELFRPFRLPLLNLSKLSMLARAREAGFDDVMSLTWFCHRPRGESPCGTCGPCRDALREGMAWRLPPGRRLVGRLAAPVLALRDALRRRRSAA